MNALPLLIGGAIIFAVMQSKKTTSSNSPIVSKFGSKDIGYEIINCNKVIIYDEKKAFSNAFLSGFNAQNRVLSTGGQYGYSASALLMGNCLIGLEVSNEKDGLVIAKKFFKDQQTVSFVFHLFRYFYSGVVKADDSTIEISTNHITFFKLIFKNLGFDVSKFETTFVKEIKKEIPKPKEYPTIGSKSIGYEIINCNSVIIYDAPTALSFAFTTGKTLPKNYQYNSADLIKKLFGKCLINLSLKKDQSDEARFLFDLMKYGYSGIFLTVGGNESIVINPLVIFKQELEEKFGIDTSKFIVEVITEP